MNELSRSLPGRCILLAITICLAGAGGGALFAPHSITLAVAFSAFIAIATSAVALGMATREHWEGAVLSLISLPFFAFLYVAALPHVLEQSPSLAYALLAGAGCSLALALRPARRAGKAGSLVLAQARA